MTTLTVREPFAGYSTGDRIEDEAQVAEILAGENASHVIPTAGDAAPAPKAPKPPKADPAA
jgi:hypothetical protein